MSRPWSRRRFLQVSAVCAVANAAGRPPRGGEPSPRSRLVLNDDGYVFLNLNDDLHKPDLRRYLESYCRPGVSAVAYCVGDMSWPTLYPSRVGAPFRPQPGGGDLRRARIHRNAGHFAAEPGGYFGAAFGILRELGKRVVASFRMNDAHFTSPDNPNASEFWRQHAKLALGPAYGYYGGCLNYASDAVREHFYNRVVEFADLYPQIDGIELDAMRSPFFFPPGKGPEHAGLLTDLVRRIKAALASRAKRLNRPDYELSINVPLTPELALECGLDVAAWDRQRLFDSVSIGTYQAYMNHPVERWKKLLAHGTPVLAYIGCSPQTGRYLGLEEYRAAAANAHAAGADGIYLFNFPCLYELAAQVPAAVDQGTMPLPDLRTCGHCDFTKAAQALDEIGRAESLRGKDKRFLFYFSNEAGYRHFAPDVAGMERRDRQGALKAAFRCHEDYGRAREIVLRFKIEHVARTERFQAKLNGRVIEPGRLRQRYAANGRDTRIHSVALGPYLEQEAVLQPADLRHGENLLEVAPLGLADDLTTKINLLEIELLVRY